MKTSPGKARWAAASAALALLVSGFVFTTVASAGVRLVVSAKIEGLGTPPHILVGASGDAPRFAIDVTTDNNGNTAMGQATGTLIVDDGQLTRPPSKWKLRGLGAGKTAVHTVIVENLRPELGFIDVKAKVGGVSGKVEHIAVEPREWDVPEWSAEEQASGADNVTNAGDGFYLRFQKYDGGFVYQAFGPVTDTPKSYPGCSSMSGSKTITQTPWAGSTMKISADLTSYSASVPTTHNPFFATCNIGAMGFQIQDDFVDLTTAKSTKKPDYVTLTASATSPGAGGGTVQTKWTFTAHIPKP